MVLALASLCLSMARADTITLTGTCSPSVVNATHDYIEFNLSNSGNGTATDILLLPKISGASSYNQSVSANILAPESTLQFMVYAHNLSYPGDYAENFLVEYGQGSSTFIALFPCLVPVLARTQSAVLIEDVANSSRSAYNATIVNPSYPVNASVQVVVPEELTARPSAFNVELNTTVPSRISFNVTPLASGVGTFTSAIEASYVYKGMHYASLQTFGVSIGAAASGGSGDITLLALAAIIICIIALIAFSIARGRARPAAKTGDG